MAIGVRVLWLELVDSSSKFPPNHRRMGNAHLGVSGNVLYVLTRFPGMLICELPFDSWRGPTTESLSHTQEGKERKRSCALAKASFGFVSLGMDPGLNLESAFSGAREDVHSTCTSIPAVGYNIEGLNYEGTTSNNRAFHWQWFVVRTIERWTIP